MDKVAFDLKKYFVLELTLFSDALKVKMKNLMLMLLMTVVEIVAESKPTAEAKMMDTFQVKMYLLPLPMERIVAELYICHLTKQ